jgi:hypothetical protein
MNCTLYMMNCNPATHATCLLTLTVYKYSELQNLVQLKIELQGQLQNTHFSHCVCFVSFQL